MYTLSSCNCMNSKAEKILKQTTNLLTFSVTFYSRMTVKGRTTWLRRGRRCWRRG